MTTTDLAPRPMAIPAAVGPTGNQPNVSREVAAVQGAMILARQFPRHEGNALAAIEATCQNPRFADAALYEFPRGGERVTGLSIRAAEALAQAWGNIDYGFRVVERRDGSSRIAAFCWDLQTNVRVTREFEVAHVRDTKNGRKLLFDERDIYELEANMAQRRVRAAILEVIPRHVSDAAEDACRETQEKIEDIEKARAALAEAFKKHGVTVEQVETRIGKKWAAASRQDIVQLKRIAVSLRDGMSKPEDWFHSVDPEKFKRVLAGTEATAKDDGPRATPAELKARAEAATEFDLAIESAFERGVDVNAALSHTGNVFEAAKQWDAAKLRAAADVLNKAGGQ